MLKQIENTMKRSLKEIRDLLEAATPGPWGLGGVAVSGRYIVENEIVEKLSACGPEHGTADDLEYDKVIADSKFIAASPAIVAQLLEENEAMREALKVIARGQTPMPDCEDDEIADMIYAESVLAKLAADGGSE